MLILWNLRDDVRRFNELKRLIPGSTQKMLTSQLRELELIVDPRVWRRTAAAAS